MTPELDTATSPEYVSDLPTIAMDEVRARRARCQILENATSYVRRLVQGRLDIVGGELQRRREGGDPADLGELIGRLPDILTEHRGPAAARGPGSVRPPLELEPDAEVVAELQAQLDAIVSVADLGELTSTPDADLVATADRLAAFEQRISSVRRGLHEAIALIQAEITRRYRTGEATVDSLLS